jgi:hypothetical protein
MAGQTWEQFLETIKDPRVQEVIEGLLQDAEILREEVILDEAARKLWLKILEMPGRSGGPHFPGPMLPGAILPFRPNQGQSPINEAQAALRRLVKLDGDK